MTKRFTVEELRRSSVAVYLAATESVADQLSAQLRQAAEDAETVVKLTREKDALAEELKSLRTALEAMRDDLQD